MHTLRKASAVFAGMLLAAPVFASAGVGGVSGVSGAAALTGHDPVLPTWRQPQELKAALQAADAAGVGSVTPLSPAPEAGSAAFFILGLLLLGWQRRARRHRSPT